jgi:hypothetical protein
MLPYRIKIFDSIPKGLQVLENVTAIGERYQIKKSKNKHKHEFGGFVTNDTFVFAAVKSKMGMFDKRLNGMENPILI